MESCFTSSEMSQSLMEWVEIYFRQKHSYICFRCKGTEKSMKTSLILKKGTWFRRCLPWDLCELWGSHADACWKTHTEVLRKQSRWDRFNMCLTNKFETETDYFVEQVVVLDHCGLEKIINAVKNGWLQQIKKLMNRKTSLGTTLKLAGLATLTTQLEYLIVLYRKTLERK